MEPAAPNSLDFLYTELKRASPPPPWPLVLVVFGGFVLGMVPAEAGPEVAVPPIFTLSTDSFKSIFCYYYCYILFSTSFWNIVTGACGSVCATVDGALLISLKFSDKGAAPYCCGLIMTRLLLFYD